MMKTERGKYRESVRSRTFILFILMILLSCGRARGVRVAVASNFTAAAEELRREYLKVNPETKIEIISGSSGRLAMQIIHGAPFHLFFSADMEHPEKIRERGLAAEEPLPYAYGRLILLRVKGGKGRMTLKRTIEESGGRIIIANPQLAPYGKAAMETLGKTGMYAAVKSKLVIAENVVQAARYALLGKGICFTARSLLLAPAFREREGEISWMEIDHRLYGRIIQGAVMLPASRGSETARSFYEFVLRSREAKRIIRRYGYTPAENRIMRSEG